MAKSQPLTWTRSECIFSPCRTWRYTLERWWGEGKYVNFLCLNPSTADEVKNDPTVHRCCHYARRWGYAGCVVTNIFALRSTDPQGLLAADDPVGPENDEHIRRMALGSALVVAAWGTWGKVRDRGGSVAACLDHIFIPLYCLGTTKDGFPRHPLYLPAAARPVRYEGETVGGGTDAHSLRRAGRMREMLALGNAELLEETLRAAAGDDYDGCFTPFGEWEYRLLPRQLRGRLADWLAVRSDGPDS